MPFHPVYKLPTISQNLIHLFTYITSNVLSASGLFHLLCYKLQELLGTRMDRKVQNEYAHVSILTTPTWNPTFLREVR